MVFFEKNVLRFAFLIFVILSPDKLIGASSTKTVAKQKTIETQLSEKREFCSKVSEKDVMLKCEQWIENQKKNLKDRVLTTYCDTRSDGDSSGCMFKTRGEIKYILRTTEQETTTEDK